MPADMAVQFLWAASRHPNGQASVANEFFFSSRAEEVDGGCIFGKALGKAGGHGRNIRSP